MIEADTYSEGKDPSVIDEPVHIGLQQPERILVGQARFEPGSNKPKITEFSAVEVPSKPDVPPEVQMEGTPEDAEAFRQRINTPEPPAPQEESNEGNEPAYVESGKVVNPIKEHNGEFEPDKLHKALMDLASGSTTRTEATVDAEI
jgi:hypothetical protein